MIVELNFFAAGSDYEEGMENLMFNISVSQISAVIGLLNDTTPELTEIFCGMLNTSDPAVVLVPSKVTVTIEDEDPRMFTFNCVYLQYKRELYEYCTEYYQVCT